MIKNKKIAYLTNIYPKVSETFIEREIRHLRKIGYEVCVCALRREKKVTHPILKNDINNNTVYLFPEKTLTGLFFNLFYFVIYPIRYSRCIWLILSCIWDANLSIFLKFFVLLYYSSPLIHTLKIKNIINIHAHFSNASTIGLFCKIMNPNFNFGFTAHASADIYYKTLLLNEKMANANYVISISKYNKQYLNLISNYRFNEKIRVVYNGVNIEEYNFPTRRYSNKKTTKLLSVGNFTYIKGYPTLIEAMRILKSNGFHFSLEIIGRGEQKQFIQEFIIKLNLAREIFLLGELENEEVLNRMAECDIFVLPSEIFVDGRRDGLPTVLIEAMSKGSPVISTHISGIPELITNGETGLLVHEKNPDEICRAIIRLIQNPELRMNLAKSAYNHVLKNFNIDTTIKLIEKIFSQYGK